jgi:hypothetical protein
MTQLEQWVYNFGLVEGIVLGGMYLVAGTIIFAHTIRWLADSVTP